jgi:Zn-dependent M28 family amino/carboxypeptidase
MQERGFDNVFLQPVMVPRWVRGDVEKAEIVSTKSHHGRSLNIAAIGGSISTPPDRITASVLEVKSFEELLESENRAKGKIIFFNRPMDTGMIETFSAYGSAVAQRVSGPVEAAKAGGVAAIVRSVTTKYDNVPHVGTLVYEQGNPHIPGVTIGLKDADYLSQALKDEHGLKVKLTLACKQFDDVESYNVIGEIIGSEYPDEIIVVGGHFDSWDKGDGSHDDGAGCIQSLEVLDLFLRLGIKPRRTIRAVFFMNEEFGLSGAELYGRYAEENNIKHVAAIESDRGAYTPRGFYVDDCEDVIQKIRSWLPYLNRALIEWVRKGGSGADVGQIKNASALIGYVPDVQRYFDVHHSANDVFEEIHPREFELGTAAMAILTYLISQEGLQ